MQVICDYCGAKFSIYGRQKEAKHHFCCNEHRILYAKENGQYTPPSTPRSTYKLTCRYCGETIYGRSPSKSICDKCRVIRDRYNGYKHTNNITFIAYCERFEQKYPQASVILEYRK